MRRVARCAAVAVVYLAAAELSRRLHVASGSQSIIWPPTGLALAAVLLWGPGLWPGIAIGTFVTVLLRVDSVVVALWISSVNVGEALVGYWVLRRLLHFRTSLDRMRDVLALLTVAIGVALVAAGLSVGGLVIAGVLPADRFNALFSTWWWGHISADLVVAPLVLTWGTRTYSQVLAPRPRPIEVFVLAAALLLVNVVLFTEWFPDWLPSSGAPYYLLPLLLWAGLRFGPRGAATASFGISIMAIAATMIGRGPFVELAGLQAYVSISSTATLVLSALGFERLRAVQREVAIQLAAFDAIISLDNRGRVSEFNPAAEAMFGYRAADVLGKDAGELLLPPASRVAYRAAFRAYLRVPTHLVLGRGYPVVALRADGSELPVEVAVANVSPDGEHVITGFLRDMTSEQLAEQARMHAQELLENKVHERTTALMLINRELERGEELLRQAEELAHLGSFELDLKTGELQWSDELYRIYGCERASYVPTFEGFLAAIHIDDRERVRAVLDAAILSVNAFGFEERIVRPDGSLRTLQTRGKVFRNGTAQAIRMTGCCQDITDQKAAEEARYRLVDIAESSEDAMIGLSITGQIESWNAAATKIFGYVADEVLGRSYTMLADFHRVADLRGRIAMAAAGEHLTHYEMPHRRKSGTIFDASVTISAIRDRDDRVIGLSTVLRDITSQKSFENQLKLSLREKEVLLREIHHRVKNNLQVISSLLNLQVSAETSEHARKGLLESQSRIQSMALVHQQLYQSKDLARIDFTRYLRELAARLLRTYNVGPDRIELTVTGPAFQLDIDRAIPCGLIVNELVANAIDHAFPGGRRGHISVALERASDGVQLSVRDDGIGIPPDLDLATTHSFGLQIARTLTEQLEGSIELIREHGTTVRLQFPTSTRPSHPN